jgi:hypothetical protein
MSPHSDPLVGQVFRQRPGGPDPEYILIADAYEVDGQAVVRVWRYTVEQGMIAVTEEAREWIETLRDEGHWEAVEGLPAAILEQVSGDEVPSEHSA